MSISYHLWLIFYQSIGLLYLRDKNKIMNLCDKSNIMDQLPYISQSFMFVLYLKTRSVHFSAIPSFARAWAAILYGRQP